MEATGEEERLEKDSTAKTSIKLPENKKTKSKNHKVKKRRPRKYPKTGNDVYVRKSSSTKTVITFCERLLNNTDLNFKEIKIHGLGKTCKVAINAARGLVAQYSGIYDLDIQTEQVTLTDDLEPVNDDADYEIRERTSEAVHVRVFSIANVGPLRFEN